MPFNQARQQKSTRPRSQVNSGLKDLAGSFFLLSLMLAIWVLGTQYWDERYYTAEEGIGYWMGISGGVLILFAMTYSYIKRRLTGSSAIYIKYWFRVHIFAGIFGPMIILLHTTFQLGSINGMIAFYATLAVFLSGLTGRYILSGLNRVSSNEKLLLFKRLMGLWKHIHIPLLYILFISGVLHVVAVHLY